MSEKLIQYANSRTFTRVGNSIGVTAPPAYLRKHGLVDEDGELVEDAEVEVWERSDGTLMYRPVHR